jgi:hypothetical protein
MRTIDGIGTVILPFFVSRILRSTFPFHGKTGSKYLELATTLAMSKAHGLN